MAKEMVPVVVASALWGSHWSSHHVCFHVDNLAVVAALNKGSSKEPLWHCYAPFALSLFLCGPL